MTDKSPSRTTQGVTMREPTPHERRMQARNQAWALTIVIALIFAFVAALVVATW